MFFAPLVFRNDHWLARKIDFLVRVSRRVPKVPRFYHCRSTVRRPVGADGVRVNPSRARLQTPRAVSPTSRHRPSELSVATVGQATGTKGQLSGDLASCDAELFRNGSQCPLDAGDKCPAAVHRWPTAGECLRPDNRVQRV